MSRPARHGSRRTVRRFPGHLPEQVKSGEAVEWFKQALEQRREE